MILLQQIFHPDRESASKGMKRSQEVKQQRMRAFHTLREHYLVKGSSSVMDIILRWMRYAKAIAMQTPKTGDFEWRNGGKILVHRDIPLQVDQLQVLARSLVDRARGILIDELCFAWDCTGLEAFEGLQDHRECSDQGYSFLQHPSNLKRIEATSDPLLKRSGNRQPPLWSQPATSPVGNSLADLNWNHQVLQQYLNIHEIFLEDLLILCLMLGGQPPRGTEILTVQFKNTQSLRRNIFLVGGVMALVTTYHKGQSKSGFGKEIPRFLPTCLRNLILGYLYFVRPFVAMLQRVSEVPVSAHGALVWGTDQVGLQSWNAEKLSLIFARRSQKIIGYKFTLRNYRQIAIKIDQDLIRKANDLPQDSYSSSEEDEDDEDHLHDKQAAHTSKTAALHYGRNLSYTVPEVDQSLWEQYRNVSEKWHIWLAVDTLYRAQVRYPLTCHHWCILFLISVRITKMQLATNVR